MTATLISKSKVEQFSRINGLDVFVDDIINDRVYVKITKPKFQLILIMHYRVFEKLFEQYRRMRGKESGS